MTKHKFYEIARRAHCGTSFTPEKRAASYCEDYDTTLAQDREKVASLGGDPDDYEKRFESKWLAWMYAKANCLSTMIAGPSKFPVRRAEKANNTEHRRMNEFSDFRKSYVARLEKKNRAAERAASNPVEEMRSLLKKAEARQEMMKSVNKICHSKKLSNTEMLAALININISEPLARELMQPDWTNKMGFASYQLTNNNANIRRMRDRLAELEAKSVAETKEVDREDGIRVVENTEADRLQIFFPGKPSPDKITLLKKNAYKWSPSNGCWQRQLTDNARRSLRQIL